MVSVPVVQGNLLETTDPKNSSKNMPSSYVKGYFSSQILRVSIFDFH